MSKVVLVDFPVDAICTEDAVRAARIASDHLSMDEALNKGLANGETDWLFTRVEIEANDGYVQTVRVVEQ